MVDITQLKKRLNKYFKVENVSVNIIQPRELLKLQNVDTLEVRFSTESYIIEKKNNNWITYHYERSLKSEIKEFDSESEACLFFYDWLTKGNR